MGLFTTTTQIFVLSLIGSTFAVMIASSVLDAIADHKSLVARFRAVAKPMPRVIAH